MLPPQEKRDLKYTLHFLLIGLFLLGVVFFTPYTGFNDGKSFFTLARATEWQTLGDWVAAWCSVKIMLLSVAGLFFVLSIEEILLFLRRVRTANVVILVLTFPLLGFGVGFYYLLKALL